MSIRPGRYGLGRHVSCASFKAPAATHASTERGRCRRLECGHGRCAWERRCGRGGDDGRADGSSGYSMYNIRARSISSGVGCGLCGAGWSQRQRQRQASMASCAESWGRSLRVLIGSCARHAVRLRGLARGRRGSEAHAANIDICTPSHPDPRLPIRALNRAPAMRGNTTFQPRRNNVVGGLGAIGQHGSPPCLTQPASVARQPQLLPLAAHKTPAEPSHREPPETFVSTLSQHSRNTPPITA